MIRSLSGSRISGTVLLLMFGLMICISGLNGAAQVPAGRGPDPQTQLLNNYRKYVDRYIRISDEAWKYDEVSHSATHSFTLKNNAGVAYSEIELRVNYLDAKGKPLRTQTLKIPGILAAYASRKFANLKARNISHDCDQAVLTISKATIHP